MLSSMQRKSRDTANALDIDFFKRRTWNGFAAEIVRIASPARYEFKSDEPWCSVSLLDLYRTDGVTIVTGVPRSVIKDLRNKITFVPAGCSIEGWCSIDRVATIISVTIDPAAQFEHRLDLTELTPRLDFEDQFLREDLQRFGRLLADPTYDLPGYADALVEVLGHDLRRSLGKESVRLPAAGALSPQQVRLIVEYVDEHLSERLSISDLAALVNLTRYHFMRSFKQAVGVPPHQFMVGRKVERAKEMLKDQNQSVTAVAVQTGFRSSMQLARAFRRVVGTTPSEFRRHVAGS